MSKVIALATVTYVGKEGNVLCKIHSQSNASNKDLGIPEQSYIVNGEERSGHQTLRLAGSNFKEAPFAKEFVAIELDPASVRSAEGGKMMQTASFKVLAIGQDAKQYGGMPTDTTDVPFK